MSLNWFGIYCDRNPEFRIYISENAVNIMEYFLKSISYLILFKVYNSYCFLGNIQGCDLIY